MINAKTVELESGGESEGFLINFSVLLGWGGERWLISVIVGGP